MLRLWPGRKAKFTILNKFSGVLCPGRLTLLLGPPGMNAAVSLTLPGSDGGLSLCHEDHRLSLHHVYQCHNNPVTMHHFLHEVSFTSSVHLTQMIGPSMTSCMHCHASCLKPVGDDELISVLWYAAQMHKHPARVAQAALAPLRESHRDKQERQRFMQAQDQLLNSPTSHDKLIHNSCASSGRH